MLCVTFLYIYFEAIFIPLHYNAHACVHFVPVSMHLAHRDVDSRYEASRYYIRGQSNERKPVVSECRMRLPHVYRLRSRSTATRKDKSPFEDFHSELSPDFSPESLFPLPIFLKVARERGTDSQLGLTCVIKFNLFRKDAELTFSRVSSLPLLADIFRSCEVYFCFVKKHREKNLAYLFLICAKLKLLSRDTMSF